MESKCVICGSRDDETHHLILGSNRRLADEDGLTIRLCFTCHRAIHDSGLIELKSKELGQELYELKRMVVRRESEEVARREFMSRYGKNYL